MTTFADLVPSPAGRFDGIERPYAPEDVLRLRRAEALNRELFGLCDVICFMNAGSDASVLT